MAKQPNEGPEAVNAEFQNAEIVQTSIVPASEAGPAKPALFTVDNKDRLIKAIVTMEVMNYEKGSEDCKKLAKKYSKLKVKDQQDEEGYKSVKSAYNELVKIRTSTEKKRKELNEPYNSIKKGIDSYASENIVGVLSETEKLLKAEKDKFENWEKERLEREAAEAKKKLEARVSELNAAGLVFDGQLYSIGESISMDLASIGKLSDSDYLLFLGKVQSEKERIDEEERLRIEAEEAERAEVQRQKDENDRKAKELRDEILEVRRDKLLDVGFTDDPAKERFYIFIDSLHEISYDEAAAMNRQAFSEYISAKQELKDSLSELTTEIIQECTSYTEEANNIIADVIVDSVHSVDAIEGDLPSIRAYINSLLNMPLPTLRSDGGKEILAAFKNSLKWSANEVLQQIDPNYKN